MSQGMGYIIVGAIFDTIGDLMMKNWVVHSGKFHFILGMVFYLIGLGFLAYSFTTKKLVVASVLFLIVNIVLLSLVNWFYYGESLNNREVASIVFGLTAIVLFEFN